MRREMQYGYGCPRCGGADKKCRLCKGKALSLYEIRSLQPEIGRAIYHTESIGDPDRGIPEHSKKLKHTNLLTRIIGGLIRWIRK